jgi:hypothetical protein
MLPRDASFRLNARISANSDIVSDFPLKYVAEPPAPPAPKREPVPEAKAKTPKAETKESKAEMKGDKGSKTGPIIAPIIVPRVVVVNPFKRITAICGSGDANITLSSFGGTLHLKKM